MMAVVVPLLQLLPLRLVREELVAGELAENGMAAGGIVSGCYCYCGFFCRGCC